MHARARWMTTDPPAASFDDGLESSGMRRRLLKGGVGFAPVLQEALPRSSLHGVLAPAAPWHDSSAAPYKPCAGYTPDSWRDPWLAFEWPAEYARSGLDAARFDPVFGERHGYPGLTFLEVLELPSVPGKNEVARHVVAAALNSAKGLTPAALFGVDILRSMWHSYVTLGHCVPVPGVQWTAESSSPPGAGSILQWLKSTMRR